MVSKPIVLVVIWGLCKPHPHTCIRPWVGREGGARIDWPVAFWGLQLFGDPSALSCTTYLHKQARGSQTPIDGRLLFFLVFLSFSAVHHAWLAVPEVPCLIRWRYVRTISRVAHCCSCTRSHGFLNLGTPRRLDLRVA